MTSIASVLDERFEKGTPARITALQEALQQELADCPDLGDAEDWSLKTLHIIPEWRR